MIEMDEIRPRERGQENEAARDDDAIATAKDRGWVWTRNHS